MVFYNLYVTVPPQRPKIFDEGGRELTSVAGPYEEGSEMKLTCVVSGGNMHVIILLVGLCLFMHRNFILKNLFHCHSIEILILFMIG